MNLLIAGDTVPKENNIELFENEQLEKILGSKLLQIWEKANYKIFNLEAPITKNNEKIKKAGPNLKVDPIVIKGIKKMKPSLVLLANNHIMDYGYRGLKDTLNILNKNNIAYIGIGENTEELKKSYVIQCEEKKIAIYNCCEREFSIATSEEAGANPCDLLVLEDEIRKLKSENDYVIVIYHGGKEHYRYPSPFLQELCRKIIDYGADLISCQHSHCIGCYEEYKGNTIVYGQGNFIFDGPVNEYWNTSLILNVNISEKLKVDYIPIKRTEQGTSLAEGKENEKILKEFEERSNRIKEKSFVKDEYKKFANEYFYSYLNTFHGDNIIFRIINKIFAHKLTRKCYSKNSFIGLLNIMECEAHRELFIEGLKNQIYNNKKESTRYE